MDGVVEPARKEVLALPPPASPGTPPPATTAEVQSPVSPAQAPARTEPVANGGEAEREEWITVFG
jgi:nuclear pore complex protein Nup53